VSDRRILKLLRQWLEAGIISDGSYQTSEIGSPQGGLCEASHNPPYAKKVIMQSNLLKC